MWRSRPFGSYRSERASSRAMPSLWTRAGVRSLPGEWRVVAITKSDPIGVPVGPPLPLIARDLSGAPPPRRGSVALVGARILEAGEGAQKDQLLSSILIRDGQIEWI